MAERKHQEPSGGELTPVSEEYEAGYAARFRDEAMSVGATASWQTGWSDANRELGRFDEAFTPAQSALPFFGTGEEARRRGLPFDPDCSEDWKRGWIAADIFMGLNESDLSSARSRARTKHEADRRMLGSAMKRKGKSVQLAMHCRCGREAMLAHGMCSTCYTLRRQDDEHFGGLREMVLERDGYRCRVCDAPGTGKRSIIVHHRVPGRSELKLMIALCPACHARVHRTKAVLAAMPPLLLELWREQHPRGHEQTALDFRCGTVLATPIRLF